MFYTFVIEIFSKNFTKICTSNRKRFALCEGVAAPSKLCGLTTQLALGFTHFTGTNYHAFNCSQHSAVSPALYPHQLFCVQDVTEAKLYQGR